MTLVEPIRIAPVGIGKIALDQHLPAITASTAFTLAATVSRTHLGLDGIFHAKTLRELLDNGPAIDAVALCAPPQVRYDMAVEALRRGVHVFLEKPPGATLSEVAALQDVAESTGATLFASWHSRYAAGVSKARDWLANRQLRNVSIVWREDVRVWHPGQDWIWEPGGLGVFDPGINALSILTHILPKPVFLKSAVLQIPENRAAPIAADVRFSDTTGTRIHLDLDWRQTGPQSWNITVDTDAGSIKLSQGGAVLSLPTGLERHDDVEYAGLYARFADLVRSRKSDVDIRPMKLVADAFLCGHKQIVEAFHD